MLFLNGKSVKFASFEDMVADNIPTFRLRNLMDELAADEYLCKDSYILNFEETISAIMLGRKSELKVVKKELQYGSHINNILYELSKSRYSTYSKENIFFKEYISFRRGETMFGDQGVTYFRPSEFDLNLCREIDNLDYLFYQVSRVYTDLSL